MSEPQDYFDDETTHDEDDEDSREADCGRWINGRLTKQCRLAGSEWCDWECPLHNAR